MKSIFIPKTDIKCVIKEGKCYIVGYI